MGSAVSKQYIVIAGKPILHHTLEIFDSCSCIDDIFVVLPAEDMNCFERLIPQKTFNKKIHPVKGGKERQDSVYNGIMAVPYKKSHVVIHDAVRPFVSPGIITECVNNAIISGACVVGVPAVDTLKQVSTAGHIVNTIDRGSIWMAQTPQVFDIDLIRYAHEKAKEDNVAGTDDAMLVERIGRKVNIIAGTRLNLKITTPEDILFAEALFKNLEKARSHS